MPSRKTTRRFLALTAGMATITLAACGGDDGGDDGGDAGAGPTSNVDCADFEEYGDLEGTEVSVYTSIISPEDQPHIDSYDPFEECTGATVDYEGSREFEAQLQVRLQAGNPPDVAYIPQPGLIRTIAESYPDVITAVGEQAEANTDEFYNPQLEGVRHQSTARSTALRWALTPSPSCGTPPACSRRPATRSRPPSTS